MGMIEWNLFNLQNGFSPIIEEFILFHDYLIIVLMFILSGVIVFILCFFGAQFCNRTLVEGQFLEALWTILPALALIRVALPSLRILYNLDTSNITHISLKVLGHQWYWSYEYRDFWAMPKEVPVIFDSYIISENDLDGSLFRLLDADNRAVLPYLINARVLISSADVLHSWALPSIGVKLDATPGRLNQLAISRYQPGVLYGQCSEICGANHSYIPIVMEFINVEDFNHWTVERGDRV